MIKSCRKVLNGLRSLANNSDNSLSLLEPHTLICATSNLYTGYDYTEYKNEIHSILRQLAEDKYIAYINNSDFILTQRGLHPYRFQWEAIKTFLLKSILVPIGVSFVTTLATLLLQWLLSGQ